jgi:hypothetical protein
VRARRFYYRVISHPDISPDVGHSRIVSRSPPVEHRGGQIFVRSGACSFNTQRPRRLESRLHAGSARGRLDRSLKMEPEAIVFVIGQQDAPSCCGGENLWPHHFLTELVRQKAPGGLGFDGRHPLVGTRQRIWLELHQTSTFSRRFFLKRSPCIAFSTSLTRTGI